MGEVPITDNYIKSGEGIFSFIKITMHFCEMSYFQMCYKTLKDGRTMLVQCTFRNRKHNTTTFKRFEELHMAFVSCFFFSDLMCFSVLKKQRKHQNIVFFSLEEFFLSYILPTFPYSYSYSNSHSYSYYLCTMYTFFSCGNSLKFQLMKTLT